MSILFDQTGFSVVVKNRAPSLGDGRYIGLVDRFSLFPVRSFRRLFVKSSTLHLAKHAFAPHFLLEHTERLIDIVVADEDLQETFPFVKSRADKNCRDMSVATGL